MKDVATILDVLRTQAPELPELPEDANDLQKLAHAYALGIAEDELRDSVTRTLIAVECDGIYKRVRVNMRGVDGNSLVVVGTIKQALRKAGAPYAHVQIFLWLAMRGDYEHLLQTCATWVTIVDEPLEPIGNALDAFRTYTSQED